MTQSIQKKILKWALFATLFGVIIAIWMYAKNCRKNQNKR